MRSSTQYPYEFSSKELDEVAHLAGLGFGNTNSSAMQQDAYAHVMAADSVQLVHDEERLVAFSMVRSCLWRAGA